MRLTRALSLDPSNRYTLVWQAQIYTRLNRWDDAEKTFRRALKEHPNYWLAYNELGFGLQGRRGIRRRSRLSAQPAWPLRKIPWP